MAKSFMPSSSVVLRVGVTEGPTVWRWVSSMGPASFAMLEKLQNGREVIHFSGGTAFYCPETGTVALRSLGTEGASSVAEAICRAFPTVASTEHLHGAAASFEASTLFGGAWDSL